MSSYKITYFKLTGLAEPIRFLLSYLKADFEDVRIARDQWPSLKQLMPFGKLPVLEIDGKVLNQSMAICRYLAKKAGLVGSDDWESLLIDVAVDNINDLRLAMSMVVSHASEETKAEKHVVLINETAPYYMDKFEKIVAENNGYFVNGKLSWADLYFVAILETFIFMIKTDLLDGRPKLQALKERVLAIPQIKSWIEKRPSNDF
jgi:glutathione S-transferase